MGILMPPMVVLLASFKTAVAAKKPILTAPLPDDEDDTPAPPNPPPPPPPPRDDGGRPAGHRLERHGEDVGWQHVLGVERRDRLVREGLVGDQLRCFESDRALEPGASGPRKRDLWTTG